MEAYLKECQGFEDRDAVRVVVAPLGSKVLAHSLGLVNDDKVEQGVPQERKVGLCARGIRKLMESMIHILLH